MDETERMIHWSGSQPGTCTRKDAGTDKITRTQGQTTLTWEAKADHPENVTCPVCRAETNK